MTGCGMWTGAIFEESAFVEQGAGGFEVDVHVGEHPLDGLEFADVFAKGFAGAGIFHGFVEGALGEADGLRGNADASGVESGEGDPQTLAFFTEAIFGGDDAIVQKNLYRRRGALAHFVFVAADFESGKAGFDKEGGNSLPGEFGIGFGEDNVEASGRTVGDPGFGAVENIVTDDW